MQRYNRINFYRVFAGLLAPLLCGGCIATSGMTISGREDIAQAAAQSGGMIRQDLKGPDFILASWRKIAAPDAPVHVYIEGDGLAWLSRSQPSMNPTPKHPLALSLAVLDPAPNVIYIARPCQYNRPDVPGNAACRDSAYWRGKRFAAEVVRSYQTALDDVAKQNSGGFHLIGYSGGANIAGLIATERSDVLSLRTVAGNLDNDYFTKFHKVSDMPYSLNMADKAKTLAGLPQLHFIGDQDTLVPRSVYDSYAAQSGETSCLHYKVVESASHEDGWEGQWPVLLSLPVGCD